MPMQSLCLLPDDTFIDGVFQYLEPRQLVRLRLTCTRFYNLIQLRYVWLKALEKLRNEQQLPLPYPARPISSLSAAELESTASKMVTLDDRFTRPRAKPSLIRMFNIQGATPRFSCMHLLAGGEWLLTANAEDVMCWDLSSPNSKSASVYKLAPVSVSGKDQGYKDICVRNLQAQICADGNEAVVAAYMSYDGHSTNVWNDKVAVWRITGLLRKAELASTFVTLLCFPDYAPEYGMSDLSGDWVAFLGREHETPVISVTNWRTGNANEYDQAKFRPDFSPLIPEGEPLRVQGIKLMPPYVIVVAGPVVALFPIPSFDRVKHLCGDAPRLPAQQIHRFDSRVYTLNGEFLSFAQNPAIIPSGNSELQPITFLTTRARITLFPSTKPKNNVSYILPPTVSRVRMFTHRTSKPAVIGPSGTRGIWIQRALGCAPRLIAWTAARDDFKGDDNADDDSDEQQEQRQTEAENAGSGTTEVVIANELVLNAGAVAAAKRSSSDVRAWDNLPCGRARKVDMHPVKVEDVKRVAFDEGTGRICLGMRGGEVHVLDFA
ncbi:hypothetical protein M422DRAFT_25032 [Sphaerobolus stellatus SS14]|nr:hypothetical protein M422DRAFT_25032 [Sphaerobolus stellatus SS14]